MAELRSFRGIRYNQMFIGDLAQVICPPYDVITPQMLQDLYRRSEYNFVRIEFNSETLQDNLTDNKYTRSAAYLQQWLNQGILKTDVKSAFYIHNHHFIYKDKEYQRRGIIALVHLEDWDKMVVRPHENTLSKPKSDRLKLLRVLNANTSSVLALIDGWGDEVLSMLSSVEKDQPIISFDEIGGENHNIWAVVDSKVIDAICHNLVNKPVYIADGHHRYESALNYQREKRLSASMISGDEAFNFIMMTLVDFADPGLLILPTHRLLKGISGSKLAGLEAGLKLYFEVEKLPIDTPKLWQKVDELSESDKPTLIIAGLLADHLLFLKMTNLSATDHLMPNSHSRDYNKLDASIVDHVILEKLLELDIADEESIAYSHDRDDVMKQVSTKEYQLAFILKPQRIATIRNIVDVGDRMPRKSTYFYPKVPAGLVFYKG